MQKEIKLIMETRFKIVYTEEAYEFIHSLPEKVQDKIAYNIFKSRVVIDKELFKKLEGTDIWEFRTLYNGICYRLGILGYRRGHFGNCHSRLYKENAEDPIKRN